MVIPRFDKSRAITNIEKIRREDLEDEDKVEAENDNIDLHFSDKRGIVLPSEGSKRKECCPLNILPIRSRELGYLKVSARGLHKELADH